MKDEFNTTGRNGPRVQPGASIKSILSVDVDHYQSMLDEPGLSDAEIKEQLEALWLIMVSFIELGYEVHPLQEVCGQDGEDGSQRAKGAFDQVRSKEPDNEKPPTEPGPKADLEA